jgi:hypothetical protein
LVGTQPFQFRRNHVRSEETKLVGRILQSTFIIDERSLLSARDLGRAEKTNQNTIHTTPLGNMNEYFGGLPVVILVGDSYLGTDGVIQNLDKMPYRMNPQEDYRYCKCGRDGHASTDITKNGRFTTISKNLPPVKSDWGNL